MQLLMELCAHHLCCVLVNESHKTNLRMAFDAVRLISCRLSGWIRCLQHYYLFIFIFIWHDMPHNRQILRYTIFVESFESWRKSRHVWIRCDGVASIRLRFSSIIMRANYCFKSSLLLFKSQQTTIARLGGHNELLIWNVAVCALNESIYVIS